MEWNRFVFPFSVIPDDIDGGFIVTFEDFPEAITQGETLEDCMLQAEDCLEEAIAARLSRNENIPLPSPPQQEQFLALISAPMAAKAALHLAMREANVDAIGLADKMRGDEKTMMRLLSPRYASRISLIESALKSLGKRLLISTTNADRSEYNS
ncbi:MAG: type II toxin-antitoxin system HicB family antitoxin [Candidatus Omnitrophota bacterium]